MTEVTKEDFEKFNKLCFESNLILDKISCRIVEVLRLILGDLNPNVDCSNIQLYFDDSNDNEAKYPELGYDSVYYVVLDLFEMNLRTRCGKSDYISCFPTNFIFMSDEQIICHLKKEKEDYDNIQEIARQKREKK